MNDRKVIIDEIMAHDIITIFRHIRPDGDAAGSQLGLKAWIEHNFPQKKVYALGKETYDIYPFVDEVDDKTIEESLAIITDTSNKERIDDDRWTRAKVSIKIDHHPIVDEYASYNFTDPDAASACELVTEILDGFDGTSFDKKAAHYLYSGILTDTLSFKTTSCRAKTLKSAYLLAKTGISLNEISEEVFSQSQKIFDFRTYLRGKVTYDNGPAYVVLDKEDYDKFDISDSTARFQIAELNGVKDFLIWALFTKNEKGLYDGSLRSKKDYRVNDIAELYGGGGHDNAAGVKDLNNDGLQDILLKLKERIVNML